MSYGKELTNKPELDRTHGHSLRDPERSTCSRPIARITATKVASHSRVQNVALTRDGADGEYSSDEAVLDPRVAALFAQQPRVGNGKYTLNTHALFRLLCENADMPKDIEIEQAARI